jgi:hypothetical protein
MPGNRHAWSNLSWSNCTMPFKEYTMEEEERKNGKSGIKLGIILFVGTILVIAAIILIDVLK